MASSLTELQVLRTALGRLDAERPAGFDRQSGCTMHASRDGDFLDRLNLDVTSRQGKARVLVSGQIGVGKSSELLYYIRLARRNTPGRFWVHCDLEKEEHPDHCGPTGVLLAIFRDCWSVTKDLNPGDSEFHQIRDDSWTRLTEWLNGRYSEDRSKVTFRFSGMDYQMTVRGADLNRNLAILLGKAAQHEAVSKPSDRFGLAPDTLVHLLNRLLLWMASRSHGSPPVLFVDHVDKIRNPIAAEEVLVKATPAWERLAASLIMTAPYEYTLGELRNAIESRWGRPQVLYPVEIPQAAHSGEIPTIYSTIAREAGIHGLIPEASLRLLAFYSGGILRQFVQFLKDACKEAHLAKHMRVEISDANAVIQAAQQAYLSYSAANLELLEEVSSFGTGLSEAAILLRSPIGLLVVSDKQNRQRLRVHPLAEASLYRFRTLRKATA